MTDTNSGKGSSGGGSRPCFKYGHPRIPQAHSQATSLQNPAATAHLHRVLNVMFPPAYIRLFHQPPHSVCTLFSLKLSPAQDSRSAKATAANPDACEQSNNGDNLLEPSTEPCSRSQVIQLQDMLQESLVEHQAKPVGLCPVRRAIYDQCFDELIRQVTVGCIEQGLLLFRIRNELRMTIGCYRRVYESAISYGLSKAVDASMRLAAHSDCEIETRSAREGLDRRESSRGADRGEKETAGEVVNGQEMEERSRLKLKLKEYYESELAKRDEVIAQQRAIIKALNQKPQL